MNKKQSLSSNSELSEGDIYEVEKIINQRIINGQKEYKVIWAGYSFQEATWEPQENLKCPEKINEFIRRYQDVIRRKNLMNKHSNQNDMSTQSLQKSNVTELQKSTVQKTQLLQKPLAGRQSCIDKEKLQSSLQKSSVINQKRASDIENLKSKITSPKPSQNFATPTDQHKNQGWLQQTQSVKKNSNNLSNLKNSREMTLSNETKTYSSKVLSSSMADKNSPESSDQSQITKIIKIHNQPKSDSFSNKITMKFESKLQTDFHQSSSQDLKKTFSLDTKLGKEQKHPVEESKINSQLSESESTQEQSQTNFREQEIFLRMGQRLDIEKIFCLINVEDNQISELQDTEIKSQRRHQYFLVTNKFSSKQKLVERERIIIEQPLKLIEFYETLMIE